MKTKFKIILFVVLGFSFNSYGFELSWLGLNIFENKVEVDQENWRYDKSNKRKEVYNTLKNAPGRPMTVILNKDDSGVINGITRRVNNVFPEDSKRNNSVIDRITEEGVVHCQSENKKRPINHYCLTMSKAQCESFRDTINKMTMSDYMKCEKLLYVELDNSPQKKVIEGLRAEINKDFPDLKSVPDVKPSVTYLTRLNTACDSFFSINPQKGKNYTFKPEKLSQKPGKATK